MSEQPPDDSAQPQPPAKSQHAATDEPFLSNMKLGEAWGESITNGRARELEDMLQQSNDEPFAGVKLTGADVYWLAGRALAGSIEITAAWIQILAMAPAEPTIWHSLDLARLNLAGADLRQACLASAYLRNVRLTKADLRKSVLNDSFLLGAHLEGARLDDSYLDGSDLRRAQMKGASLRNAHCSKMLLVSADMTNINAVGANMAGSILTNAVLKDANLEQANFEQADIRYAQLDDTNLDLCRLAGVALIGASLTRASLVLAVLEGAQLLQADLTDATMFGAIAPKISLTSSVLRRTALFGSQMIEADLRSAILEGTDLHDAHLEGADLGGSLLDGGTKLRGVVLADKQHGGPRLSDVIWGGANLSTVNWDAIDELGNETRARNWKKESRTRSSWSSLPRKQRQGWKRWAEKSSLDLYQTAVRANRQLAVALRSQGLNEFADRFSYRAQILQRQVLMQQRKYGRALGSWFLDLISGYGYKPMRSFIAYIVIILAFAGAYLLNAQFAAPHLTWDEALVLSVSAFHGRGFFTSGISLGDTLARLAAGEAIIGLLIEITFIATFTQRFFAR